MEEEFDIATQWFLSVTKKDKNNLPKNYKARVWFAVERDDTYKVGLALQHKGKEMFKSFSKEEALSLADVLNQYASKLDEINSEE